MVAFELGRHFEIAKDTEKALQWYLTSESKFRRGDWKTKAREAVVRMGGELPPDSEPAVEISATQSVKADAAGESVAILIPEPAVPFEQTATAFESLVAAGTEEAPAPASADDSNASADKRHRRRGRRGGRNRRKATSPPTSSETRGTARPAASRSRVADEPAEAASAEILPPRVVDSRAIP